MGIPDMSTTESKQKPRNHEALQLLETVTKQVQEHVDTTEVLVLVKIAGDYHRFSSGIGNLMQLVATLELAKFDALQRMSDD
jgi:hypothetical protein